MWLSERQICAYVSVPLYKSTRVLTCLSDVVVRAADLCLCLGTSLQIFPCANLPLLSKKSGGRVVVVNLQATRLDSRADLVVHHTVDVVMTRVICYIIAFLPRTSCEPPLPSHV